MSEQLSERIEQLDLSELEAGDVVRITTGVGEDAFKYTFTVEEPGRWPIGQMQEIDPNRQVTGEGTFMLQGSGIMD